MVKIFLVKVLIITYGVPGITPVGRAVPTIYRSEYLMFWWAEPTLQNWSAFKKTREDELVPMILGGKQADAEKLAGGVQKERFQKIIGLVDGLGQ